MPQLLSVAGATRLTMLACLVGVGSLLISCGSDRSVVGYCAAPRSEAVEVTVRDSISGEAAAEGATGTLVGSAVDDTLEQLDSLRLRGGDQTGTYTVTIDRPGYLTWIASSVKVTEQGTCGNVIPVRLSAKLQPTSP